MAENERELRVEPRPSVAQLVALQNKLVSLRDAGKLPDLTLNEGLIIFWALGLAHGFCELNDRLDAREAKEPAS